MKKTLIVCFLSIVFLLCGCFMSPAATRTVTKIADSNDGVCDSDCSLREAIAVSGDNVVFASPLFDGAQTITLSPSFGVLVPNNITINGRGPGLTTISAAGQGFRVFVLLGNSTLSGLTISGGRDVGSGSKYGSGVFNTSSSTSTISNCILTANLTSGSNFSRGGAVYNEGGAVLTIIGSTISGNQVQNAGGSSSIEGGGGIYIEANATLNVISSTISGNNVASNSPNGQKRGGGIFAGIGATINVINSTVSGNVVNSVNGFAGSGGGIFTEFSTNINLTNTTITGNQVIGPNGNNAAGGILVQGSLRATNTIVAGNSAATSANILFLNPGNFNVNNNNGIDGVPGILALGNYGGATQTHQLSAASAYNNAGNKCVLSANACGYSHPALTTDQRGFPRALDAVDIGSVEYGFIVANTNDSGPLSLRDAVANAPAGTNIVFEPAFFSTPRSINLLNSGQILINKNLTITGPGDDLLEIYSYDFDSDTSTRLFFIDGGATLNLSGVKLQFAQITSGNGGAININNGTLNAENVTILNSAATNGGCIYNNGTLNIGNSLISNCGSSNGGGIYNEIGRTATVNNTTITNSSSAATGGGGIHNKGTLTVTASAIRNNFAYNSAVGAGIYAGPVTVINNSTISGNTCVNQGGGCGAYVSAGNSLSITNTTITNNVSNQNQTGGVVNLGTFQTRDSIIAGNRNLNGSGVQEVSGVITSNGYNLLGDTTGNSYVGNTIGNLVGPANLAPLGDYGGPTWSHALLSNSPAINAGDVLNPSALDQRGSIRPIGGRSDIGSFERNISIDQATLPNGYLNSPFTQALSVTRLTNFADVVKIDADRFNLAPFTFAMVPVAGQSLPPGLTLSAAGVISGTPTIAGLYTFIVKATDTDGIAGVQSYSMNVFVPTAANVSVSGRLVTPRGQGLRRAVVLLTGSDGVVRSATSTSFGHFRFDDVESGETYTISVRSKSFTFSPQVLTVNEAVEDLILVAQ